MPEGSARFKYQIDPNDERATASNVLRMVGNNKHVLELGTAAGSMTYALKEYNKCSVVGVEVDPASAEEARPYCDKLIVGNLDELDLAAELGDERFDVIVAADVLEHLIDPWRCLEKARGLLAPEGYLVISIPNVAHNGLLGAILSGSFPYRERGLLDRTHVRFFTLFELETALLATGFIPEAPARMWQSVEGTEFAGVWAVLPQKYKTALAQNPEGETYQFVLRAYPASRERWENHMRAKKAEEDARSYSLEEKKQQLQDKDRQLAEVKTELQHERELREDVQRQLEAAFSSDSWRVTAPMRALGRLLRNNMVINIWRAVRRSGGLSCAVRKTIRIMRTQGLGGMVKRLWSIAVSPSNSANLAVEQYQDWVARYDTPTPLQLETLTKQVAAMPQQPLISLVMPVYDTPDAYLREALDSVLAQCYPNWELCIADDASPSVHVRATLEEYQAKDGRIKVVFREVNGHISAASNSALTLANGQYIAFLDHDDCLRPHSLALVAKSINAHPDGLLFYSDEDKIDESGRRTSPYFKPDWNPDLLLSHNLVTHLAVYQAERLRVLGGVREGFEGAQDYDLVLRFTEGIAAQQICHIPHVLYHWRILPGSTAGNPDEKPYAILAAIKAIGEHLQRQGVKAEVSESTILPGNIRVSYRLPEMPPLVSIVILTRNRHDLLRVCIASILERTNYPNYEILIIDNGSNDSATLDYLREISLNPKVRIVADNRPFNFSALNNAAVPHCLGEVLAFMNNDMEVINADWLGELVSHALRSGVGAVGARLWYGDNTLQHGGVILFGDLVAGHSHKGLPRGNSGYMGRAQLTQNFSAVTGACLVIRREVFSEAGGFDEINLPIAFNDVDFCLRLRELGYRNVWTPYAELYHYESRSRGYEDTAEKKARFAREAEYMRRRWRKVLDADPAYNPNLTISAEDYSLAFPPRVTWVA